MSTTRPGGPFVTCIMPTRNRRHFVPAAIRTFQRQDYEHRELLIVDDGTDAITDLVPEDARIRYERVTRRMTLGSKRNLACDKAAGDVIVHWDDDDWSAPWRLTYQVAGLADPGVDMCGLSEVVFFDPSMSRAWRYVHPQRGRRPWIAGGTLCYRKSFWRRHSFIEINVGEDTRFVWNGRPTLAALAASNFYVAMIHSRNTSPKRPHGTCWHPVDPSGAIALLGDELDEYRRSAGPPRHGRRGAA